MTKFYIEQTRKEKDKSDEELLIIKYNEFKKGANIKDFHKALKTTISDLPLDKNKQPYEYKITSITSFGTRSSGKGWNIYDPKKPNDIRYYKPADYYESLKINGKEVVNLNKIIKYYSANIVLRKQKSKNGGLADKNDCLYYALNDCLKSYLIEETTNFFWKTPESFKKWLRLSRCDKIAISKIPQIEDRLKTSIIVKGDYLLNTGKNYNKQINLTLKDGHYFKSTKQKKIPIKIAHKCKYNLKLCIYKEIKKEIWIMTEDKTLKKLNRYEFYQNYSSRKSHFYYMVNELNQESYDKINNELKILKDNGVDILKFGNLKEAIIYHVYYFGLNNYRVDELDDLEAEFLNNALKGGLRHKKDYNKKNESYESYDINGQYSYILKETGLLYALKKPIFKQLEQIPETLPYGIYRVKIQGGKKPINKFIFRENITNYYTHYDIKAARDYGYKITLIQDDNANLMYYPSDARVLTKTIFSDYITKFYDLKVKYKISTAKMFLNYLWGILSQKSKRYGPLKETSNSNLHISHIIDKNKITVESFVSEKLFKYPYCRIAPFLTSYSRHMTGQLIKPYLKYVVKVNTDGFTLEGKHNLKTGTNLGQLKKEKSQ